MTPVELAAQTYIRAAGERDAAKRAALLEACIADDARLVTRSAVIHGRAAFDAMIARFLADREMVGFRLTSSVDAAGTTFRYRSVAIRRDGSELELFDAGEIDTDGKIITLLVFAGALV